VTELHQPRTVFADEFRGRPFSWKDVAKESRPLVKLEAMHVCLEIVKESASCSE
jgi:hypothetical protein